MIFLDLETSGLDPARHRILECAVLITDDRFNPVSARVWVGETLRPDECTPEVYAMHVASGLVAAADAWGGGDSLDGVLARTLPAVSRIAGFSPHFDLWFLRTRCPLIADRLHHRVYDCSTLRDLCGDYGQPLMDGAAEPAHRALADCFAALQVMRRFRALISAATSPQKEISHGEG